MSWFRRGKKDFSASAIGGQFEHFLNPSPLAPGLTRTGLCREMDAYVPLAAAEPPPPPPPKKPGVSPDTVWQFWWQGEASVPSTVRTCLDSVRRHVGSRPVVLIDASNVHDYLDIPRVLMDRLARQEISIVMLSDYIRLALLSVYGGTWIDATVWISGEIPSETLDSEFFVFSSPYWSLYGPRALSPHLLGVLRFMSNRPSSMLFGSSWWMSARPGALPPRVAKRLMSAYWERHDKNIDYMLVYDLLSLAFLANADCQDVWDRMPKRSTTDAQMLMSVLLDPYDEQMMNAILARTTVHKLTYKFPEHIVRSDMFYRRIFTD